MYNEIKVVLPDELVYGMRFEKNIINTASSDVIISTFSQFDGLNHTLRISRIP